MDLGKPTIDHNFKSMDVKPSGALAPRILQDMSGTATVGVRIRGTLGDIDRLNKVPCKRARSRVKKGPLYGVSLTLKK